MTTKASQTYNLLVHSFTPASFKGIVFLCGPAMFEGDGGENYRPELPALANCLKGECGGGMPSRPGPARDGA